MPHADQSREDQVGYTVLALFFAIFSSLSTALGLVLMKLAHVNTNQENQELDEEERVNRSRCAVCARPTWVCGGLAVIGGSALQLAALGFGNQVLLSGLMALGIVFNSILSVLILKEPCAKSDPFALLLMVIGSAFFVILAKNPQEDYTLERLVALYIRFESITVAVMTIILLFIANYLDKNTRDSF